jgi:hypothetical protein
MEILNEVTEYLIGAVVCAGAMMAGIGLYCFITKVVNLLTGEE